MIMLVFCGDLKYCPYIARYIERLEKYGLQYEVAFWNRSGFTLHLPENYRYYNSPSELSNNKMIKGKDFFGFYQWIDHHIRSVKPDKLILLSTLTGILLYRQLKNYKRNYIYDIRDYSFEHIRLFYGMEKKLIENSSFTAISSKGFEAFLPKHEYVMAHNFNRKEWDRTASFRKGAAPIRFVWNGVMRFFDYQKKYIDALKNDSRFLMIYHGDGPELHKYINYCKENQVQNVRFTGAYKNEDKKSLLEQADILNNCYGYPDGAGNRLKYAVSNRFYDGAALHIPQAAEPEGFKAKWALSCGIGCNFPAEDHFADKLYAYYREIEEKAFDSSCDKLLKTVLEEDDAYIKKIDEFLCEGKRGING